MNTYRSEVDNSVLVIIGFQFFVTVIIIVATSSQYAVVALMLALFGGVMWMMYSIKYHIQLSEKKLLIRAIFVSKDILVDDIVSIKESKSILSAPAASFDRIAVRYRKSEVLISPVKRGEFLAGLLQLNPSIHISDKLKKEVALFSSELLPTASTSSTKPAT